MDQLWEVKMSQQVLDWFEEQEFATKKRVTLAIMALEIGGPFLGRPLVDSISNSRIRNLKELRVGSSSLHAIRILFCFTAERKALLLVAGDKSKKWSSWYSEAISEAEEIYEQYFED